MGARPYDWMYRRGAPWESGPRPALVELCTSGRITPQALAPGHAIDLGCGTGADSIFLTKRGFSVTGVDFSAVAIEKADLAAAAGGLEPPPRFVVADLLELPTATVTGPFDLLFDGGTLDDFPPRVRRQIASVVTELSRPGSVFVMWCFYAAMRDLPRMNFGGASRWGAPPIEPGEEQELFGADWNIERYHTVDAGPHDACFVMVRR